MKAVARAIGFFAMILLHSMNAIGAEKLTTQQAKDLLIDGNMSESLGFIDNATDYWKRVIAGTPAASPVHASAYRKICKYDADFCEGTREGREPATYSGILESDRKELEATLSEIEGLQFRVLNKTLILDGELFSEADLQRVKTAASLYPKERVAVLARLSPKGRKKLSQAIVNDINNPEITTRVVGENYILEGQAFDQIEKDRAEIVAQAYLAKADPSSKAKIINLVQIKPPPKR